MKAARDGMEGCWRQCCGMALLAVLWLAGVGCEAVPAASTVQSPGPRPPASSGPLQTSSPENWRHSALWQCTRTSSTFRHTLGLGGNGQERPNSQMHCPSFPDFPLTEFHMSIFIKKSPASKMFENSSHIWAKRDPNRLRGQKKFTVNF